MPTVFMATKKGGHGALRLCPPCDFPRKRGEVRNQSNRLDTDSSAAVRAIASEIRLAIGSVRMFGALVTASVGRIESVMTSSFSLEPAIRAAAPPESTPWVM